MNGNTETVILGFLLPVWGIRNAVSLKDTNLEKGVARHVTNTKTISESMPPKPKPPHQDILGDELGYQHSLISTVIELDFEHPSK